MGIIYDQRLENDAKKIEFYAKEEKTLLKNISEKFSNASNCYSSLDCRAYNKSVEKMKNNIPIIYAKRKSYAQVLYNEITKYKELVDKTVKIFDEGIIK